MKNIALLKNPIREYAWGSRSFIPGLLSTEMRAERPQAELWMGAHPSAPSQVLISGKWVSLAEQIAEDPKGVLGDKVAEGYDNKLPFLFKILAAEKPLSIQAHPDKEQAKAGYARENRLHIPFGADTRNYSDDKHKPELICALTSFKGLKGFRTSREIIRLSDMTGSKALESMVNPLKQYPVPRGLRDFLSAILTLTASKKQQLIEQVLRGAMEYKKTDPCFDWILRLEQEYSRDIGVVFPLFLNFFHLQPGEALFIPSRELHAYFEGAALEIMANSDNVLRGGLTAKYVDIPELLKILRFEPNPVSILTPVKGSNGESVFPRVTDEFLLSCIQLEGSRAYEKKPVGKVEILICIHGRATIIGAEKNRLNLRKGVSVLVPAGINGYGIQGRATLYKATVP